MKEGYQKKPSSESTRRPILYFAGGGFDERKMLYYRLRGPYGVIGTDGQMQVVHNRRDYPIMKAVEVNGQRFVVRQMDRHVLFRDLDSPPSEYALFLSDTTLEEFTEAYRFRRPGRCVMHVPRGMGAGRCVYLFFNTDGTGFALHLDFRSNLGAVRWTIEYEQVHFWWNDRLFEGIPFLSEPVAHLRGIYESLFTERIDPLLHIQSVDRDQLQNNSQVWENDDAQELRDVDWQDITDILDTPLVGQNEVEQGIWTYECYFGYFFQAENIPLSWQSGSEQELRRLSHAICCTEPGLLDTQESVTAVYQAATPYKRGGFLFVERRGERISSRRLMSLCNLAFRLNPCIGMRWIIQEKKCYYRPDYLEKAAERVLVAVEPPTAHEKAEAFLTLVDWLDDKLYDAEKRARFGLPPRVAAKARREER